MSLRRLLNVGYEMLAEGRDDKELEALDAELKGDGGRIVERQQRDAMAVLTGGLGMDVA